MKRLYFCLFLMVWGAIGFLNAQTNPVARFYNGKEGYPAWTDRIKWDRVINMATYTNGANDFEKFENARDELYNQGGGVLYYPAGVYNFKDIPYQLGPNGRGLMLKSGVVIMGEAPHKGEDSLATRRLSDGAIDTIYRADKMDTVSSGCGYMSLRTKFVFPLVKKKCIEKTPGAYSDFAADTAGIPSPWNFIGAIPDKSRGEQLKDVHDIGIAWVDLQDATFFVGLQVTYGETWATSGSWKGKYGKGDWLNRIPDGTHPFDLFNGAPTAASNKFIGAPSGVLVFGCRFNNAAVPNDIVYNQYKIGSVYYNQDGFYRYPYVGRISIYASDVLVANTSIPKPTRSFKYKQKASTGGDSVFLWDPGKCIGVDIGKSILGAMAAYNSSDGSKTYQKFDASSPYYSKNIVIIDNYIYNHGNKGFDVTGKYLVVKNNVNDRDWHGGNWGTQRGESLYGLSKGWMPTTDGCAVPTANMDNMSRAFDYTGINVWFENNYYNNTGSYPGNDGEGILCQRMNNCEMYSVAITNNKQGALGLTSYLGGYDVHVFGFLGAYNLTRGPVGHRTPKGIDQLIDFAAPTVLNPIGGSMNQHITYITPFDSLTSCPAGPVVQPENVSVNYLPDSLCNRISWNDVSDNEIGFRVDRRELGKDEWFTVAYRPRQATSTDPNAAFSDPALRSFAKAMNRMEWNDYLIGTGRKYEYRVIALSCSTDKPVISPKGGIYKNPQTITIQAAPNASIYFTLDGSTPTPLSTLYTGPINLAASDTLKVVSMVPGIPSSLSETDSAVYIIDSTLAEVSAPVFNVPSGNYASVQNLTLTSETPEAQIYYTLNGDAPSESSAKYTSPITVGSNASVRAVAIKNGMSNSSVKLETYSFNTVAPPLFSQESTSFTDSLVVAIESSTPGANIFYTTDGSTPDSTSTQYAAPFVINKSTVVKAVAVKSGMLSVASSAEYKQKAVIPSFNATLSTSTYNLEISSTTPGAVIYYTLDETMPTTNSTVYTEPLKDISMMTKVRAIAVRSDMEPSDMTAYFVDRPFPTITPAGGNIFGSPVTVSIASSHSDAKIYYTTNGSSPNITSTVYSGPINLNVGNGATVTVKALALRPGNAYFNSNDIVSASYTYKVASPVFVPGNNTLFQDSVSVSISAGNPQDTIFYTVNGSNPTRASAKYISSIKLLSTTTLKAIAYHGKTPASSVVSATFTKKLNKPVFTLSASSNTNKALYVKVGSTNTGDTVVYTTDGTTPTPTSPILSKTDSIEVTTTNTVIKALAMNRPYTTSDVATSSSYTLTVATPVFSPASSSITGPMEVSISTITEGDTIFYTTDGTLPNRNSMIYSAPVHISGNTVLKAIAFKGQTMANSSYITGVYQYRVAPPMFSPQPGFSVSPQNISITAVPDSSDIYYTLDGSQPTMWSNKYNGPVLVRESSVLKAVAFKEGFIPSETVQGNYIISRNQAIRFDSIGTKVYGDEAFEIEAKTTSGLSPEFSVISGPASISGNVVTLTGAGIVTVRATQGGDSYFYPALPVDRSFNVLKKDQSISFEPLSDKVIGDSAFHLYATATSGLAVDFEVISGPATILGNTVTLTGAGEVVIRAFQEGNTDFNPATPVDRSFMVLKHTQSINFDNLANKVYGDAPFYLNAVSTSGLPVGYIVVSGPATISENKVTITGAGIVTIRASQEGNDYFYPAEPVERSFKVYKRLQFISFVKIENKVYGEVPFALEATTTSGLLPVFTVIYGPATISGNMVTLTGTGLVIIRALQEGNENYLPALPVYRTFVVSKQTQTITFEKIANHVLGDAPFSLNASASSGLTPVFKVLSGPASVSGNMVTLTGTGKVTICASQPGNEFFFPAPDVCISFVVSQRNSSPVYKDVRLVLAPNPASDYLTIMIDNLGECKGLLQIIDTNGHLVKVSEITEARLVVDVNQLPDGMYFVIVTINNVQYKSKFMKE